MHRSDRRAQRVGGIGREPEADDGVVGFFAGGQEFREACGFAEDEKQDAGCHRIQVQPEVLVFRRIADLEAALDIGAAALACVGAETAEHWRQSLIERESDDCFYAAVTIVQAVGKVMG